MSKPIIVFCDFDGTITYKDSLKEFIKFYHSNFYFFFGILLLAPVIILYKTKIMSNQKAKEILTSFFFGGANVDFFNKKASLFSKQIEKIIIPKALEKLMWHKNQGHKVVIVSASYKNYLYLWCNNYDFELLSTELEVLNNNITGRIKGKNCYGKEKVRRIKENYNLENVQVYAYGDTPGDKPMLSLAQFSFYKVFNS